MKTAICFSGQLRFVKECHHFIYKNLVGFDDMDVFVHTWKDEMAGNNQSLTRTSDIDEVLDLFNITSYNQQSPSNDIAPNGISKKKFIHYSMFYSIMKSNELKKIHETDNNFKYDCVIKCRFDNVLLSKLDVSKYDLNCVYSPWIHKHGVISDWLNFSNSEIMDTYSLAWNNMQTYDKQNVNMCSGEEILTKHLKTNNIDFKSSNNELKLIRKSGTQESSNWIPEDKLNICYENK